MKNLMRQIMEMENDASKDYHPQQLREQANFRISNIRIIENAKKSKDVGIRRQIIYGHSMVLLVEVIQSMMLAGFSVDEIQELFQINLKETIWDMQEGPLSYRDNGPNDPEIFT